MAASNHPYCWEYLSGPSVWLKECCSDNETLHIRFGGPSFSGKTSIVRYLIDTEAIHATPLTPTDGLEISVTTFRQHLLYMYDSGSCEDEDLSSARFINFSSKSFDPRYPDGAVFVIDGNDRGRLPLAAKLMHEFIDTCYKTSVFLILVAKCDLMAGGSSLDGQSDGPRSIISPRRLCDNFTRPSPTAATRASPANCAGEDLTEIMQTPTTATHRQALSVPETRKQSNQTVCSLREITRVMAHPSLMQKEWRVFFCSAVSGDGIEEAFDWFVSTMVEQRNSKRRSF
eukprot:Gregarina_sp_Poly_1__4561@NODE_2447_length_2126_cov_169_337057_g1553_i0_p1_GENE_NODE_2447_length_2126_cov_169_337057_g1553_i0NODE_2447_length_2126_cov_169_337057_g1553_i0_p1_ORF_typecomplete_len286_score19_31Arf/PF00025_21/2_2e08Arf/PF00025_21/2_1e06Ras/PF00071_22/1e05GTP_EFTU/PF00009_27/1_4e03GTP_EFTU/PF00009_27/0_051SRPRB/PF09439_10/0_19Gtr1_RagA/PF04670_12/0_21Adeno_IVa2/PF02456_15/0_43_NODE_2447_length_2126_cov_169_337057_g1553_i09651822